MNEIYFKNGQNRSGVTIIEVLTSIVVAVIGVAGVLILIPFGIRQAQVGVDLENATTVGENATAQFQIMGLNNVGQYNGEQVLPWVVPNQPNVEYTNPPGNQNVDLLSLADQPLVKTTVSDGDLFAGLYFIDPLWVNTVADPIPNAELPTREMFEFVGEPVEQQFNTVNVIFDDAVFEAGNLTGPRIPPFLPRFVTAIDPGNPFDASLFPRAMTQAAAVRAFVNKNDIQYSNDFDQEGNALNDLDPPQPLLVSNIAYLSDGVDNDLDGTTDELDEQYLTRQFNGELSWSVVAVPRRGLGARFSDPVEGLDFFVLVAKNRSLLSPIDYTGPSETDPRYLYTVLNSSIIDSPAGANPSVINGTGGIFLNSAVNIRNDAWIMLINYEISRTPISDPVKARPEVGFFRVIGNAANRVLIEGSDFTIQELVDDGSGNLVASRTATYAIFLKNVVGVYKRQLRLTATN
ncbi:MAG: hypothetical protein AAGA30_10030 [Planctomycetota bacterium]